DATGSQPLKALAIGEALACLLQLGNFARFEAGLVQFLALEADQRQFPLALLSSRRQRGMATTQVAHLGGEIEVFLPILLEVTVSVAQPQLVGRLQKRLALALAVNVNEETADLF